MQKADNINIVTPKLLKQTNNDDCGIFALHYLRQIFGSVDCYTQRDSVWMSSGSQSRRYIVC